MELDDAIRRILRGHWALIAGCTALAIVVTMLLAPQHTRYTASTRLVLDTADPATRNEASGIADAAKAIATSPTQVQAALKRAGLTRDPVKFARDDVTLSSLGASGILSLSVSDSDRRMAARVANDLAARVIQTRLEITRGFTDQLRADLDKRINDLNDKIARSDGAINNLSVALSQARTPQGMTSIRVRRDTESRRREILAQNRSTLLSERLNLVTSTSSSREPRIISAATVPTHPDGSGLLPDLVLAFFLGNVLGVGLAALSETLRPTLVGERAVARELDAPLLGRLSHGPGGASDPVQLASAALHLRLAARTARVRHVRLLPARPGDDLTELAARIEEHGALAPRREPARAKVATGARGAADAGEARVRAKAQDEPVTVRPFDGGSAVRNGVDAGLVIVAPDKMASADLDSTRQLLSVSPWPLLGVVVYRPHRAPQRRKPRNARSRRSPRA